MSNTPVESAPTGGSPSTKTLPEWTKALGIGLLVSLIAGLFATAFLWPMTTAAPKNIAFGVAGPEEQITQMEAKLNATQADLFDISTYDDRDAVVTAIKERDILGGLVVGADGIEMLTASAGNAQVAQLLNQMATGLQTQQAAQVQEATAEAVSQAVSQGATAEQVLAIQTQAQEKAATSALTVTDVVPGGTSAGMSNLTMIPALIGGLMSAVLSFLLVKKNLANRIVAIVAGAVLAGLIGAAVLGPWFGVLDGSYWLTAFGLMMGALAVGLTISGLATLIGPAGLGLGALTIVMFGNPWGGFMAPTEFLADPWGSIGAHMPNGTVISLIKSINFFPDASTGNQWLTLVIWAFCGLALLLAGIALQKRKANKLAAPVA